TAVFLSAFIHSVTATYSGDADFSPTSATNIEVASFSRTATKVISIDGPVQFGQGVTFAAIVATLGDARGAPEGNVTFLDGTTPVANVPLVGGSAFFRTSSLAVGDHQIMAVYGGDANDV